MFSVGRVGFWFGSQVNAAVVPHVTGQALVFRLRGSRVVAFLCLWLIDFIFRFGQTWLTQQSTGQTRSTNGTTVTLVWFRFMLGFKVRVNICQFWLTIGSTQVLGDLSVPSFYLLNSSYLDNRKTWQLEVG
ncbi:hypothetical protein HanIR_Chr01g0039141 [Helianthus annuus]|nr:hypothetical protein HanIR_Chr01g0039141 [Helianthus annuus]